MGFVRFLILFFNVAVVTFLVYRMFGIIKQPMPKTKKVPIIGTGIFLLIVPFAFVFRMIPLSPIYFLAYPVAVSLFIYLIREEQS
ncbi:MAG TPA: hypothetical protein VGK39_08110 [Cyclobacteriaceae bacterium]